MQGGGEGGSAGGGGGGMGGAGGSFFSAMTTMFAARNEAQALKASASVDRENARAAELEGAFAGADIRRRSRATQGEAISALAEGGASIGGQAAQDLLFQNSLETEYAVLQTRYSAATEARALRYSAKLKHNQAHKAIIAGVMGVGAAAVTGASQHQNQAEIDAARQRRRNAYFPGGMTLPPPSGGFTGPRD